MNILGGMRNALIAVIGIIVILIVIASVFIAAWPQVSTVTANVSSMTGTDTGTTMFKGFWPVVILLAGLIIALIPLFFVLNKLGVIGEN